MSPAGAAPERIVPPDGVILYDKPAGVTSHDIVARVRRTFVKGTRVGHAGTLDPFATGLLLVLVGRATRIQRFLMALPKRYETVARFGATSTTGDRDGEIAETGVMPPAGPLGLPTGVIRQTPPAYSAIKVGGRRAYALARAGEAVEIPEREVTVHRFSELWADGPRRAFAIECSSGTYVRSLIMDLGDAYCEELRRTRIGEFDVSAADAERIVPLNDALAFIPAVQLDPAAARRASHGVAVPAPPALRVRPAANIAVPAPPALRVRPAANIAVGGEEAGVVRLVGPDGLIALAELREASLLKPIVGFVGS